MNNQEKLLIKYQELAELYNAPVPPPEGPDLTSVRRWYRNEVMQAHNLMEVINVLEKLIETSNWDNEVLDSEFIHPLKKQARDQRLSLDATAVKLGLTPTEWPE